MNFRIIEQNIKGKLNDKCEDKIIVLEDYVIVLDGATSKTNLKFDDKSVGETAIDVIEKAIVGLPKEANCSAAISHLTEAVKDFYKEMKIADFVEKNPINRISASAAIYSAFQNEVWLIGDCQCRISKENYKNEKLSDNILANLRALVIETMIENGSLTIETLKKKDVGREVIFPFLKDQYIYQNRETESPYRYSVIDGFNPHLNDVKIIKVESKEVILASDGYPILFDTLKDTEKKLKNFLKVDKMCFKEFKSTKGCLDEYNSYDDRAFIKFEITNANTTI